MNIHMYVIHVYEEGSLHAIPGTLTASEMKCVFMLLFIIQFQLITDIG